MNSPDKIVQDTKYSTMYRLEWSDGVQSADFYNFTRANDMLKNYALYIASMERSERMFSLDDNARRRKQGLDAFK